MAEKQSAMDFLTARNPKAEEQKMSGVQLTAGSAIAGDELPTSRNQPDPTIGQKVYEFGSGFNDELLDVLNIPNAAFNWAAEKLGSNLRAPSVRDLGATYGIANRKGEEPDTGTYRAGKFTSMGMTFLAPFLGVSRTAKGVADVSTTMQGSKTAGNINDYWLKSQAKNLQQKVAAPFQANPTAAMVGEVTANIGAGYGSYYGEREFGVIGEQAGGLIGGFAPSAMTANVDRLYRYAVDSMFPFTEAGGRQRAGNIIRELIERPPDEIVAEVEKTRGRLLPGMKMKYSQLAKDEHLQALDKVLSEQAPEVSRKIRKQDAYNNFIASKWLRALQGDESIEEAKKFLGSKHLQLSARLQARVDLAIENARDQITKLAPTGNRDAINTIARKQLDTALSDARKGETALWNQVERDVPTDSVNAMAKYQELLDTMDRAADMDDIPGYVKTLLGKPNEEGIIEGGKLAENLTVGELSTLRSRLLNTMRQLKAADAPDWNKVRVVDDLQEAILDDLADSPVSDAMNDALTFSRQLNMKFKGDIMDVIFGHSKTGGSLAPNLTLDALGSGRKKYHHISRLIAAEPEIKPNIEEVLKMEIAASSVVKDGRINLSEAKRYMRQNADTMEVFPELQANMEQAIGMEEKVQWIKDSVTQAMRRATKTNTYLASISKPGRMLPNVLAADHPERTMKFMMNILNDKGKAGIKNDVFRKVLAAGETTKIGFQDHTIINGDKALAYWNKNKKVLRHAFKDDPHSMKRMEKIIENIRLAEETEALPVEAARAALEWQPKGFGQKAMAYVVGVAAARAGAAAGQSTHGASLKTASMASNMANKILKNLNQETATRLLQEAILDPEKYDMLMHSTVDISTDPHLMKVLNTYMLATTLESMEPIETYQSYITPQTKDMQSRERNLQ